MSILILAWPLVLIWLMSTGFFISLIIVSAKNIKSIDETMVDPLKRINNQPPEKMSPIVKGGLIFFALITLLFIFVNIYSVIYSTPKQKQKKIIYLNQLRKNVLPFFSI